MSDHEMVDSSWIAFLTPDGLRSKLVSASIYLAAFELLKDSIIKPLRDFFASGWDKNGVIDGPEYQSEVLARNKSRLYASLAWLRESNVIDDKDREIFEGLKNARNRCAHEMHQLATGHAPSDFVQEFPKLIALLRKIEVWWIVNVEIPTNPDFSDQDIAEDGIMPGRVMGVSVMIDVALGSDEVANRCIRLFRKNFRNPAADSTPRSACVT